MKVGTIIDLGTIAFIVIGRQGKDGRQLTLRRIR